MKRIVSSISRVILVIGLISLLGCENREFENREFENRLFNNHMKQARQWLPGNVFDNDIRKAIRKDICAFRDIANNVKYVYVNKTQDTDCYVLTFISDTLKVSLWLNSDNSINSITRY